MTDFLDFFNALWTSEKWPTPEPFPWQTMLAERASRGDWPNAIHLPTGSGKTACLDAAIFGLAATTKQTAATRFPRRIWFVVDRRIVVDEAFNRAKQIARRLANSEGGPLKEIAQILREFGGSSQPLAVARLRGGVWKSDDWARIPSQPAIICSTVDQIGSALLFRAYGHSDETASIFAGLAAHDSLILLDEAHCAAPFMQTLSAIARFRGTVWAERPLETPFRFCAMSATLPEGISEDSMFPNPAAREAALDHPLLRQRLTARKPGRLVPPVKGCDADFASKAAEQAQKCIKDLGKVRVAVMVNRVATAQATAAQLREKLPEAVDIVLLTGRIRPLDRDLIVNRWGSRLKAGSTEVLEKPVVVVTTQCLEVGADFSFDALVTECASLDALRQRFGRLNRLGDLRESSAVILIRERDAKIPKDDGDPIYGKAIYETWKWLSEIDLREEGGAIDFGATAMERRIETLGATDEQRFNGLLAAAPDTPILLAAHLDLLCQTSPRPNPEPDVSLFLHGMGRPLPDVRVVFRTDLTSESEDAWIETLSLMPPTSPEMLTVPLHRLKRWLLQQDQPDEDGDVEGAREASTGDAEEQDAKQTARTKFAIWRGREHSEVTNNLGRLHPNNIVVVCLTKEGISSLGQTIEEPQGLGAGDLDLAERAFQQARGRVVLRVRPDVLGSWRDHSSIADLVELANAEPEPDEIRDALQAVLDANAADEPFLPKWLQEIVKNLVEGGFRIKSHPAGGLILIGRKTQRTEELEDDLSADADDLTSESSEAVPWQQHTADVRDLAGRFAARCLDEEASAVIAAAAQAHDLGKLDWRFQVMLHDGDEIAASSDKPLAKSADLPKRRRKRTQFSEDARLPKGFRHEFLSMQIAQRFGWTPADDGAGDLALHLIASHHGYARPFAPVVADQLVAQGRGGNLCLSDVGIDATISAAERQDFIPAHQLDSGVADRFWRLTRRYGWWGLAYLESILRLADWEASRIPGIAPEYVPVDPKPTSAASSISHTSVALAALDGANPLAFLAALGTLRLLTRALPQHDLRLSWERGLGAWRPLLWTARPLDEATIGTALFENGLNLSEMISDELLTASEAASPKNKKGEPSWKNKLLFPIADFRRFCCYASQSRSALGEFAAAWAGETDTSGEREKKIARRTRFDFTAGQQAFLSMLRELKAVCTTASLQQALFTGWHYSADAVSMRWDIQDEKRQYALQSIDPTNNSRNPPAADAGANFLAVEALPLFPLVPNRTAAQAGFDDKPSSRCWIWPIWMRPIGLDSIRTLLALSLADSDEWPTARRCALGVAAIFQSRIVQPSGRYRCFTPARSR